MRNSAPPFSMLASAFAAFALLFATGAEGQTTGQPSLNGTTLATSDAPAAPHPYTVVDVRGQGLEHARSVAIRLSAENQRLPNQIVVLVKADDSAAFEEIAAALTAMFEAGRRQVTLVHGDAVGRDGRSDQARIARAEIYGNGAIQVAVYDDAENSRIGELTLLLATDEYNTYVLAGAAGAGTPVNR